MPSWPAGWSRATISQSCEKPEYGFTESAQKAAVGPKFLRITDIQDGRVDWDAVPYCRCGGEALDRLRLRPGDLLVARIGGTTGKTLLVRECPEAVFASYLIRLRASSVDSEFLYFFCQSDSYWRQILASKGEKLKGGVSASTLNQIVHPLPPLGEQRAIASVLSKLQARVELQDRLVTAVNQLKAATMMRLFREGLRGEPLKQTDIGEIPISWDVVPLALLVKPASGGTPSKARREWWEGRIPWASPKDMKTPRLWDTEDHISAEAAAEGSRLVPAKTIFVVTRGMILARDLPVAISEVPMAFNQDMRALQPTGAVDPDFLFYAISARKDALTTSIGSAAHGTRRLGSTSVEALAVPRPKSEEEQKSIAQILRSLEDREEFARRQCGVLRALFKASLGTLMTGRLRVRDVVHRSRTGEEL